jgi:hypothetical protein
MECLNVSGLVGALAIIDVFNMKLLQANYKSYLVLSSEVAIMSYSVYAIFIRRL